MLAICDVEAGKVKQTLRGFPADAAAFTADGAALVTCQCFNYPKRPAPIAARQLRGMRETITLGRVDLKTGKSQCCAKTAGTAKRRPCLWPALPFPRRETAAVPGKDGKILLLDTATGKPRRVLEGAAASVPECLAISPDGLSVAEGTRQGSVIVWTLPGPERRISPDVQPTWGRLVEAENPHLDQRRQLHDQAQLVKVDGDAVVLKKKGGKEVKVPLEKLGAEDREFAKQERR